MQGAKTPERAAGAAVTRRCQPGRVVIERRLMRDEGEPVAFACERRKPRLWTCWGGARSDSKSVSINLILKDNF